MRDDADYSVADAMVGSDDADQERRGDRRIKLGRPLIDGQGAHRIESLGRCPEAQNPRPLALAHGQSLHVSRISLDGCRLCVYRSSMRFDAWRIIRPAAASDCRAAQCPRGREADAS